MSLSARQRPLASDEAMRRYLAMIRKDLEPDPLFRRRLRGTVVNRFVAVREGLASDAPPRPSRMGRLGRACLYATFALAVGVGGTMAASRSAMPGDLLYPVKLQVEALRLQTFPDRFHDDLVAYSLAERINEMGVLAEAGDWDGVARMAASIEAAYGAHEQHRRAAAPHDDSAGPQLAVLEALVDRLPPHAQSVLRGVLDGTPGRAEAAGRGQGGGRRDEAGAAHGRPNRPAVIPPAQNDDATLQPPARTPRSTSAVKPSPTPRATPSPRPMTEPEGEPEAEPEGEVEVEVDIEPEGASADD